MDGSSGSSAGYVDDIDRWSQQVEYQDIKAQQQLTKQHYGSPTGTPEHYSTDPSEEVKAGLTTLDAHAQGFSEMERLSNEFQPEVQGPLVGALKSSKALEIEYANADPAFVRKTIALTPKYAYYRTIRGDGNCGWRAVAFGFFELLLRSGDLDTIGMEHARLTSLNGLMDAAGFEPYIYEDFASETRNLFTALSTLSFDSLHESELLKRFNDPSVSDSIITHFKFLTSAWMKTRPEEYEPWLDRTVMEYCGNQIEPYGVEIDHVGLMALIDCLILPAGFAVEVSYLDRSSGAEANVHRFEKLEGEGVLTAPNAPVLRLLYRPGHYDILYRKEEIEYTAPDPPSVQVSFLPTLPEQTFQATPLSTLPTFPFSPLDDADFVSGEAGPSNFRHSMLSMPEFQPSPFQPLPFQTTTFRNSPFNPSHFQSENFQPEIYQPPSTGSTSKRSDKSSGQTPQGS